jgi:hypothetical protein
VHPAREVRHRPAIIFDQLLQILERGEERRGEERRGEEQAHLAHINSASDPRDQLLLFAGELGLDSHRVSLVGQRGLQEGGSTPREVCFIRAKKRVLGSWKGLGDFFCGFPSMRFDGRGDREERVVEDLSLLEVGSQRSSMELHGRSKLGRVGAMERKLPEKKEFDKVQLRQSPVARTRGRQP